MKSILDTFFGTGSSLPEHPLTNREEEELCNELAQAAADLNHVQASPEHQRVMRLIQEKMRGKSSESPK